jgi:hypothetical protein
MISTTVEWLGGKCIITANTAVTREDIGATISTPSLSQTMARQLQQ